MCQQRMPVNLSSCFQPALQSCVFWLKVIIMSTTTHTLERLQTEDFWGHRGTHMCSSIQRVVSAPWRCLYPVHGAGLCIYISQRRPKDQKLREFECTARVSILPLSSDEGYISGCSFILKNVVSEETDISIMFSSIDYILGQKLML